MNIQSKIQSFTCPCCRGFIGEAAPIEMVLSAVSSTTGRKILEKLSTKVGKQFHRDEIIDFVYASDPSGGPDDAAGTFSVTLFRLRQTISDFGWTIEKKGGGGHGEFSTPGLYRLIPTEARQ